MTPHCCNVVLDVTAAAAAAAVVVGVDAAPTGTLAFLAAAGVTDRAATTGVVDRCLMVDATLAT
jgi:hypothetical protein